MKFNYVISEINIIFFLYLINITSCNTVTQYFKSFGTLFGYGSPEDEAFGNDIYGKKVPFEVATSDDKFIEEAAKLTGVALSELDSCQHRVVLKLQTSCQNINDEQLAKLAVMLLNCQSSIEGRQTYPCTDSMTLRECTTTMDADTWNTYHLMTNRARAVCYSIRQAQFRGLTELTVNRLLGAAKDQISTLSKINEDQEKLQAVAENTLNSVTEGQVELLNQQKDLQQATFYGQLALEDNIRRLGDEKKLISEGYELLKELTRLTQNAAKQLTHQAEERRGNHQELLDDLVAIQNKAHVIFQRLEDSSEHLMKQSESARIQYEATLQQLAQVNATITLLVDVVNKMRNGLEEKLMWLSTSLGGTDEALERVWTAVWHLGFLLFAMLCCAFLNARNSTRFFIISILPLNLVASIAAYDDITLDHNGLILTIMAYVLVQAIVLSIFSHKEAIKQMLTAKKVQMSSNGSANHNHTVRSANNEESDVDGDDRLHENTQHSFTSSSPLRQRIHAETHHGNGSSRSVTPLRQFNITCSALTRAGTPCKISTLPGRDLCYRHQNGSSIAA